MKKAFTLIAALFFALGFTFAQDVYFSGNDNGTGKIWKNNTLIYSISDTTDINLYDMKVDDNGIVYSVGYSSADYRGHVWMNDSVLFTTDTSSFIKRIILDDNGWTAAGGNTVWQNGETLYSYSIDSATCNLYALAIDGATGDIYAGGSIVTPGVYASVWKNDTIFWQCPDWSEVNDLSIDGGNLFAAGFVYGPESIDGEVWQNDSIIFQIEGGDITAITAYNGSLYWAELSTSDNTAYIWQDGEVIYSHPECNGFNTLCVNEYGVYYAGIDNDMVTLWKDGEVLYQPEDCQSIVAITVMPNDDIMPYSLPWHDGFETDSTYWDEWAQINDVDSLSIWERFQDTTGFYNARHLASDTLQTSWLITPPLFLQPNQDSSFMTFQTKELNSEDFGYSGVWISTATSDTADFTEIWSQDNPSDEWNQIRIDLSEYQNNIIYLAFKYSGEQAHDWYIDDINVIESRNYYNIIVEPDTTGWGTVTGGGTFYYGDTTVIEAIPNLGYEFLYWNDSIPDNPLNVVVTQDSTFIAYFGLIDYNITASVEPEEAGTVTGGGLYHYGDTLTLEAIANDGFVFEMWSDSITDNPRDIIVTQDSSFVALFNPIGYSITTSVDPENAGTVTEGGIYHYSDTLTLEAVPNAGFVFEMWNDSVTDNPRDIIVTQDSSFIALFSIQQCLIETQVIPEGTGFVTGGGNYPYGDTIQLEATPNLGYEFLTWDDGNTDNPRTVIVTGSQTFTATFGIKQCVVTVVASPAEGGIVMGGGTYSYGDTILLVAQNYAGYVFKIWSDEVFENPRQVIVQDDITYTAIFSPLQYQITTASQPEEGGTVEGAGTYLYGETATLYARPSNDYSFLCWSDGIVSNPRYITVTQNASYTAMFRYNGIHVHDYVIKVMANNPDWGTVTGEGIYTEGTTAEISAIPTDSTQFIGWDDGNTDNPRSIFVTADMTFTAIFELIPTYTITVSSFSTSMGTVFGSGTYQVNTVINIGAIPNQGYRFTGWQDDNTDNPRTITVTEDAEYVAYFSRIPTPTYTVTVYFDENQGFILGAGTYTAGATASLAAIPADGYMFVKWSDGTTDNPKEVIVDHDIELSAFFNFTSVDEDGFETISLYPNPADDKIRIEGLEGQHEIQIYNAYGMLVKTANIDGDSEIDLSNLSAGYYFLRVEGHTMKFVKE